MFFPTVELPNPSQTTPNSSPQNHLKFHSKDSNPPLYPLICSPETEIHALSHKALNPKYYFRRSIFHTQLPSLLKPHILPSQFILDANIQGIRLQLLNFIAFKLNFSHSIRPRTKSEPHGWSTQLCGALKPKIASNFTQTLLNFARNWQKLDRN